jgi:hypothetical protein
MLCLVPRQTFVSFVVNVLLGRFATGDESHGDAAVPKIVIPAKAGIHSSDARAAERWVPAFAGTTTYLCVFASLSCPSW